MISRHKQLKEIEDMIEIVKRKLLDEMYRENAEPYSGPTLATLKGAGNYLMFAQYNLEDARTYGKMLSGESQ